MVNAFEVLGRCLAAAALTLGGLLVLALLAFTVLFLVRLPFRHPTMGPGYCAVRTICWMFTKLFYRLKVKGLENVPKQGGALLVCNHVSYVDVVILGVALDRPVRFLSWEGFERMRSMRWVMRMMGTIPVAEDRAKEAIQRAADALRSGELVCIFPEGHVTRNGGVQELRRGFELIARRAGAPILPAAVDGLWGSIFSFSGGKFFWKRPKHFPRPVSLVVGRPYPSEEHQRTRFRLLELASEAFAMRPSLGGSLAREVVRGMAARAGRVVIVDRTAQRRELSGAVMIALASEFAREVRRSTSSARVAVLLPPGIAATVANLGCLMAGRVPVNLNFTLGREQAASCLRRAGTDLLVTAEAFRSKVAEKAPDFPWGDRVCDIADVLKSAPRWRIALKAALVRIFPASWTPRLLGVPSTGGDAEAALLFTSGSSGEPKGVILSHRNLLANLRQIEDADILPDGAVLLSSLPVFHSFGFTVGVWYALSRPVVLVTLPSPLDSAAAVRAIREEKVTVVVGTPTFLRPYLRRGTKEDFASLEWAVVGAEKCPLDLVDAFRDQFDVRMLEGYGITETSPVLSVNVPDRPDPTAPGGLWTGNLTGSVGRPVMGVAVRTVSPDDGRELPPGEAGLLEVRAPNVFCGYLGDPARSSDVLRDGWYRTGDLARMDEQGFLHLAGRLSRFSKIGGEMVPHGTVEDALRRVIRPDESSGPAFAVSASNDPVKGEQLVVLHACDIDPDSVREALAREGLANLWIPKVFKKVPAVPVLGTGKLDLSRLRAMAQE